MSPSKNNEAEPILNKNKCRNKTRQLPRPVRLCSWMYDYTVPCEGSGPPRRLGPLLLGTDWEVGMKQQPRCSRVRCGGTRASLLPPMSRQLSTASPAGQSMSTPWAATPSSTGSTSSPPQATVSWKGLGSQTACSHLCRLGFQRTAVTFLWSSNFSCQTFTSPSPPIIKPLIP